MNGDKAKALAHVLQQLRARWGWFVGLGVVLLLLGGLAMIYVIAATLASVVFIAMLMIIGGAAQLVHAWGVKTLASICLVERSGGALCIGWGVRFS